MFMTKLFFQRCVLSSFIFLSFNIFADSPLTSISFWDISQSALVQKTGKQKGKKKLNNVSFKFLIDSNTTIFDKIAMVNALGWDSNSKFKNSEIFLNKLKKENLNSIKKYRKQLLKAPPFSWDNLEFDDNGDILRNDKNDKHFIQGIFYASVVDFDKKFDDVESLWWTPEDIIREHSDFKGFGFEDNYTVYLYLLAMDNYWDDTLIFSDVLDNLTELESLFGYSEELDEEGYVISVTYNNSDSKEAFDFIKMLVSTQYLLLISTPDCEVWEEFNQIIGRDIYNNYKCISNLSVRKAIRKSYDYLKIYSGKCDLIRYQTEYYCNVKVIHAKQNQKVWICHYPIFIYGNLNVYDQNNNEVFKFIIDGDDCVGLDVSTYPIGSYRIQMMNTETEPKTPYNLELIIY